MKKIKWLALVLGCMLLLAAGCTENIRTKRYGGTMKVDLPAGQKLVTATWKDTELWYLTRPMRSNEVPETCTFQEKSAHGLVEGTVIFHERN